MSLIKRSPCTLHAFLAVVCLLLGFSPSIFAERLEDVVDKLNPKTIGSNFLYGDENIDPYTGSVNISYRDIYMPGGQGSLDISYTRHLEANHIQQDDGPTVVAARWSMNRNFVFYPWWFVRRVIEGDYVLTDNHNTRGPDLELTLPNGEIKIFYLDKNKNLISKDFWKADAIDGDYKKGIKISPPDSGLTYYYTVRESYVVDNPSPRTYKVCDESCNPFVPRPGESVNDYSGSTSAKQTNYFFSNTYSSTLTRSPNDNTLRNGIIFLLSKVEDRFGNNLQYSYSGNSGYKHLSKILANDGRELNVERDDYNVRRIYSSDGQDVSYQWSLPDNVHTYDGYRITKVEFLEGFSASYKYHRHGNSVVNSDGTGVGADSDRLKNIEFSTGRTDTYQYKGWTTAGDIDGIGDFGRIYRKTITDDKGSRNWTYTGGLDGWHYNRHGYRKVVGPLSCTLYEYIDPQEVRFQNKYADAVKQYGATEGMYSLIGKLHRKSIYSSQNCSGTPTYSVTNEWAKSAFTELLESRDWGSHIYLYDKGEVMLRYKIILFRDYEVYDVTHKDIVRSIPYMTSQIITVDGYEFTKEWSDFNEYYQPQTQIDYMRPNGSTDPVATKRQVDTTFWHDTSSVENWTINKLENETISSLTLAQGSETEYVKSLEGEINRTYYDNGLLKSVDELGINTFFEYHPNGAASKKILAKGTIAEQIFTYDNFKYGVATKETWPNGGIIERDVNQSGLMLWEKDAEGNLVSYQYDALKRLKRRQIGTQNPTIITWPSFDLQVSEQGKQRTETLYNAIGQQVLSSTIDTNEGGDTVYVNTRYDLLDRVEFRSIPSFDAAEPSGEEYVYDELDRIVTVKNTANDSVETTVYGAAANSIIISNSLSASENWWEGILSARLYLPTVKFGYLRISPDGYHKIYNFSAFGNPEEKQLTHIIEQAVKKPEIYGKQYLETEITRSMVGSITKVKKGTFGVEDDNVTREFVYEAGRPQILDKAIHPEVGTVEYSHNPLGKLQTAYSGEELVDFQYDSMGQLYDVIAPNSDDNYSLRYDKNGLVKIVSNKYTQWNFDYNPAGQLTDETLTIMDETFPIDYGYDLNGNMQSMTYPSGEVIDYNPNGLGKATTLGSYAQNISYHPNGYLNGVTYANGFTTSISQDTRGMPSAVSSKRGTEGFSFQYDWDEQGNLTSITDNDNALNNKIFSYDGVGRIVVANSEKWGGDGEITYDSVDNILTKNLGSNYQTYTYDASNRLGSVSGGYTFEYDTQGNVTNNGKHGFIYNTVGQLARVTGNTDIHYFYDGRNKKVATGKTAGNISEERYSVYNYQGQLVHEKNAVTGEWMDYYLLNGKNIASRKECPDLDSDGDWIPDCVEKQWKLDPNNPNDALSDLDGDGLSNYYEYAFGLNPNAADTNGDGNSDLFEVQNGLTEYSSTDDDNDGLTATQEFVVGSDIFDSDSDDDGIPDGQDSAPLFNAALLIPILHLILN